MFYIIYIFTLYFTLYLFHRHIFICVVSHLQAYLERQSQLNMKKQKGRGKGRGRGRGGSRKKTIAEDDDDEEQEEEEEKPMKPKKNKRHYPKEEKPEPKRRLRGKQAEDDGPGWTEEMWEEYAKWQWGGDWKQWEDETTWDCWDPQRSFDRYACLESQCALSQLDSTSKKESGKKPTKNPEKKKAKQQDDEKDHMASSSKHSKDKKSESTADQEETTVKKRKLEVDTVPAQSFEVPRKVRDQANLIACFAKEACELGIKNPTHLTQENKAALKMKLPTDLEETRYNSYYKRPGFGLHIKAIKKDFGYFSVEGTKGNFLVRLAASWKAASMLATRMNVVQNCECV